MFASWPDPVEIKPSPTTLCSLGEEHENRELSPKPHAEMVPSVFFLIFIYLFGCTGS